MDLNRYTEKAQQAVAQAQSLAAEHSHGQIEGEHLLLALLRQSEAPLPVLFSGIQVIPFVADTGQAKIRFTGGRQRVVAKQL